MCIAFNICNIKYSVKLLYLGIHFQISMLVINLEHSFTIYRLSETRQCKGQSCQNHIWAY